ncbi:hypothetical protein KQX54_014040 [Cotesia glomerata]|uniref:Uncharacterized protein n=1 Tax=Cotesia glomerata TaxID=32391 RepID=A0AAV7ISM4_COTGL|nr:hypothetical protein KQX54_014040 [Cotesia glomerata]
MKECMKIFKHLVVGDLQEDQTKEGVLLANRFTVYRVDRISKHYTRTCTKVSKGAIPRRPPTTTNKPASSSTYVKTRVFTRSQPPTATPRRCSVSSVPAPARTLPVTTAEPTPMEVEEAAALPTRSQRAADTQVTSTSTFMLPECPPHLTPAFAAYKASLYKKALERAARTGIMETGIPRAEKMPEPQPSDVPIRRKTGKKKKKKRKKGELRGPNWSEMEFGGNNVPPVSEDSVSKNRYDQRLTG